jgi:hypothetical protein
MRDLLVVGMSLIVLAGGAHAADLSFRSTTEVTRNLMSASLLLCSS